MIEISQFIIQVFTAYGGLILSAATGALVLLAIIRANAYLSSERKLKENLVKYLMLSCNKLGAVDAKVDKTHQLQTDAMRRSDHLLSSMHDNLEIIHEMMHGARKAPQAAPAPAPVLAAPAASGRVSGEPAKPVPIARSNALRSRVKRLSNMRPDTSITNGGSPRPVVPGFTRMIARGRIAGAANPLTQELQERIPLTAGAASARPTSERPGIAALFDTPSAKQIVEKLEGRNSPQDFSAVLDDLQTGPGDLGLPGNMRKRANG